MENPPILEVRNITKIFDNDLFQKKKVILDDLSLKFHDGKCTAFMGHNGAGKTTTIRIIFGLMKPDKGQVLYRGQPIKQADKKNIGYMPETNKLPLNLTCEEILLHQLRIFNPDRIKPKQYDERIEESLREINLWDHRKKKVGSLSKGLGRRLSWAQATVHKPELIILDEPMSGLDPLGYKLMSSLIKKLRSKQVSIVLCTHELWSIQELCDEAYIIQKGRLCYSTNAKESSLDSIKSQLHKVTISGLSLDDSQMFLTKYNLPLWVESHPSGHKIDLLFSEYSEAVKWLSFSLQQGLVVVNFQKTSRLDEQHLIKYFEEKSSQ